jgi:hypothetical protein
VDKKIHSNSRSPIKKKRKKQEFPENEGRSGDEKVKTKWKTIPLTQEEKRFNRSTKYHHPS